MDNTVILCSSQDKAYLLFERLKKYDCFWSFTLEGTLEKPNGFLASNRCSFVLLKSEKNEIKKITITTEFCSKADFSNKKLIIDYEIYINNQDFFEKWIKDSLIPDKNIEVIEINPKNLIGKFNK